ncbi:MAG: hypothetical protein H5T84_11045, partial [Thermoleophilia bacterium]|nr:hypothetical protein [Thermoleophilia bacterium]
MAAASVAVLGGAGELSPLVRSWAGPLFGEASRVYTLAWLFGVTFAAASLLAASQVVARGIACVECILAATCGRHGCGEENSCGERGSEQNCRKQIGKEPFVKRLTDGRSLLFADQIQPELGAVGARKDEISRDHERAQYGEKGQKQVEGAIVWEQPGQEHRYGGSASGGGWSADSDQHPAGPVEHWGVGSGQPAREANEGEGKHEEGAADFYLSHSESHNFGHLAKPPICDRVCGLVEQGVQCTKQAED